MPRKSIADLRKAIEEAPEMTAEHRQQMLELVDSLEKEVTTAVELPEEARQSDGAEKLRGAIAVVEDVVRRRSEGEEPDHDLGERLSELEARVEMVALEHPVIANVLAAISRLV